MFIRRWFASLLVLSLLGSSIGSAAARPSGPRQLGGTTLRRAATHTAFVPGQLLVRLHDRSAMAAKGAITLKSFQAAFPALNLERMRAVVPNTYRLDTGKNADVVALANQIAADPSVAYAQPNYLRYALRSVDDPLSTFQYALNKIDAYGAWDVTTGSSAVTVAVVDSGVNAAHPDLAGRVLPGYDFANDDADAGDDVFHGTQVAGIVAAAGDNGEGTAGLCWSCNILPVKVLNDNGAGSDEWVAKGIRWAVDHGAQIINLSLGGPNESRIIREAVVYATQKNVLVVAAAGNEADEGNPIDYPAAYDEVIAVGATDHNDQHAYFSQVHSYVDLAAPGWNVATTGVEGNLSAYGAATGTSFSAPYVAGLAALLLSVNPSLDVNGLKSLLINSADDIGQPGRDWQFGAGRINAARAVRAVRVPAFDPVANPNQPDVIFFPETGHTLRGTLRAFWEQNGGLPVFGFPVSEEFSETTTEGTFTVQYFERNRLELHPDKAAPYNVLLGRLSDSLLQRQGRNWFTFAKGQPSDGCQFFNETGHSICEPFLTYWKGNGLRDANLSPDGRALALFGLPLSEPALEINSSGENVLTQWFERARFEFHPGNEPRFQVLLGLLGNESARPGAGGSPASGRTPANRCEGLPPSLNATVQPSGCILPGTYIDIDAGGFEPGEEASFYYSSPDGQAVPVGAVLVDEQGRIQGQLAVLGLPAGFWALVLRGNQSSHEAVIYLKVVDR